ncbi:MAG TPA: iron ABC transporter permease [Euzebya sp.]|nr:iron ABC transporter permease [Euzebya sp.]
MSGDHAAATDILRPPRSGAAPPDVGGRGDLDLPPVRVRRAGMCFAALAVTAAALFCGALALGSVSIPLAEVVTILLGGEPTTASWATIVRDLRLPRSITAVLAGAGLSVSGLQLQTLFRNPLADPFVLGISSGASLGVALVSLSVGGTIFIGTMGRGSSLSTAAAAAVGAAAVLGIVLMFARRVRSISSVLIIGLMTGYLATSIVSLMLFFSDEDDFRGFLAWSLGSFRGTTWSELQVLLPVAAIGVVLATITVKGLNAMLLGERYAESVGVAVGRLRALIILSSSLLAGVITAFTGPVAFLGLAVPHLCRSLFVTSDHRVLLPAVVLMGACVALMTEIISGLPGTDLTLPVNAVTPILGAPVVIIVLLRLRQSPEVALS